MTLRIDHDGPVTVLTLHRPEARNALSGELITQLRAEVTRLGADDSVRAVVLTGTDPAFCAGLDLKEVAGAGTNLSLTTDEGGPWPQIDKPVIAAINGVAVTGGLELALACDLRIAGERAAFADTHARVGVMPGWGLTVRLPKLIGPARALEMSLGSTWVDAATAQAWGLVNRVVPDAELMPTVLELAHRMAEADAVAARTLLQMYRDAAELAPAEALRRERRTSRTWIAAMDRSRVPSPAQLRTGRG